MRVPRRVAVRGFVVCLVVTGVASGLAIAATMRPSPEPPPRTSSVRVGALNVSYDTQLTRGSIQRIVDLECDVVVLFEWTGANVDLSRFREAGYAVLLDVPRPGAHGTLVMARAQVRGNVVAEENSWASRCAIPYVDARLTIGGASLWMLGMHAPPPIPLCEGANDETLFGLASSLVARKSTDRPDLIIGDFNALPFEPERGELRRLGYVEAVRGHQGRWVGTWTPRRGIPPMVPIDEALVRSDHQIVGAWAMTIPESDHRLVVVDVRNG